jgi:prepilin-type N-terminal cleavage/methylation domain-containing protein
LSECDVKMQVKNKGFTLVELMVVILVIGILAAIAAPLMNARVDKSKWSEACTSAGIIRTAVRNYASETSIAIAQALSGEDLGNLTIQQILDFAPEDLEGTYFSPGDYTITSINSEGIAAITITGGSKDDAPIGSYILQEDGRWVMQ